MVNESTSLVGKTAAGGVAALSPDGLLLAVANAGSLELFDTMTGSVMSTCDETVLADSLAFSPDGTLLASCGRSGLLLRGVPGLGFQGAPDLSPVAYYNIDLSYGDQIMAFCGVSILRTDPDGPPRLTSTHGGTVRLLRPPLTRRVSTQARRWNVASSGHGLAATRQGTRILLWNTSSASGKGRIRASFAGSITNCGYPRSPGVRLGGTYAQPVTSLAVRPVTRIRAGS